MHQAVLDLRQAVDATKEKYQEISKDPACKKVLASLERKSGSKLKLGPSRQFQLNVKLLERAEVQDSSGESGESTVKGVGRLIGPSRGNDRPRRPGQKTQEAHPEAVFGPGHGVPGFPKKVSPWCIADRVGLWDSYS